MQPPDDLDLDPERLERALVALRAAQAALREAGVAPDVSALYRYSADDVPGALVALVEAKLAALREYREPLALGLPVRIHPHLRPDAPPRRERLVRVTRVLIHTEHGRYRLVDGRAPHGIAALDPVDLWRVWRDLDRLRGTRKETPCSTKSL